MNVLSQAGSTNMATVLNFVNIEEGVSSDITTIAFNTPHDTAVAA